MGERRRRRMMMAYHEAAHAVLARRQGLACAEIRMSGSVGALTASASYESGEAVEAKIAGYEIDGAVALAGPVANVRFSGRPSSFSDGAESDLQIAQAAAGSIALLKSGQSLPGAGNEEHVLPRDVLRQANDILAVILQNCEALVDEHWAEIDRVAKVLMHRDLITASELDQLIAETPS